MATRKRKPCSACGLKSYAVKTGITGRFVCKPGLGCRSGRTAGHRTATSGTSMPRRPARTTTRGHKQVTWRQHQQNRKPQRGCYCATCCRKRKARTRRVRMGIRGVLRPFRRVTRRIVRKVL